MNAYVKSADAFFLDLVVELQNVLDLHPGGISQETAWLHFKRLGRKASVDQLVTALNHLVRDGALTSDKNHKNETIWRRIRSATPLTVSVSAPPAEPAAIQPPPTAKTEEPEPMPSNPKPPKTAKSTAPRQHGPGSGERIELAILSALADGTHTRKILMARTGASGTGVDNALSRLVERKAIRRTAGVRGVWQLRGAAAAPATASSAPTPVARAATSTPSAPIDEVAASIQRFSTRLQPVDSLAAKLTALDQLAKVMPQPIAEILARIRGDLVRLADA